MNTYIDLYNHIIKFNNSEIVIVFDEEGNSWFHVRSIAKALEYVNFKQAIRINIPTKYKRRLDEIIRILINKDEYKNLKPQTLFINDTGLNILILRSNKLIAKEFQEQLAKEVIPSIKKEGKYIDSYKDKK